MMHCLETSAVPWTTSSFVHHCFLQFTVPADKLAQIADGTLLIAISAACEQRSQLLLL
jgi:hypothetical protein